MPSVYILYSNSIDHYYIGSCDNLVIRLEQHLSGKFDRAFTHRAKDWKIYFEISDLDYQQARKIEEHIKRMKSRLYIKNLILYPEMTSKLKKKYAGSSR